MKQLTKKKWIALAILLAIASTACDKPGPAEEAGKKIDQSMEKAGSKIDEAAGKMNKSLDDKMGKVGQVLEDSEITSMVKASLFGDSSLKSLQISVDTIKGAVTLNGTVDSSSSSEKAKALAHAVNGVNSVNNNLKVMPAQ
jgi:hyperosmotically inducible periplasmic protein